MSPRPWLPPVTRTSDGSLRRVGVELELSGIALADLSAAVVEHFGGTIDEVDELEHCVRGSSVGDFRIELDYDYLKRFSRDSGDLEGIRADVHRLSVEAMAEVARLVVPMEIVSPPLEPARLQDMDMLVAALRRQGGRGTRHSAFYAFGLHLNPEVPALDPAVLLRYLRAFLCLCDWLTRVEDVDWSRRVTPYIDPFPREYVLGVLAADFEPDQRALIAHYLAHNAVRNRALDMLPLFALLDPHAVAAAVDDVRVNPRPTFHYRLPNCDVDVPGWGLTGAWANWLKVEQLAEDRLRLADMCARYTDYLSSTTRRLTEDWAELSEAWMD